MRGPEPYQHNERHVIGALTATQLDFLEAKGAVPGSGSISIGDADIRHMQRDVKAGKWTVEELSTLPALLAEPRAILWDNGDPAFLYIGGDPAEGSPAVAVVTVGKIRPVGRSKVMVNQLRTTSRQEWKDLRNTGHYSIISGSL
jgi:hypothetical protein